MDSVPLRSRNKPHGDGGSQSYVDKDEDKSYSPFASSRSAGLTNRPAKPATSASKQPKTFWTRVGGGIELGRGETRVLAGLTLLGSVVRFWKLGRPGSVVFDEVHFGGFANKYIQSRFFMDVHPPLAKLLITLMAWVSGFQGGSFDFKDIGREYGPEHVPYIAMRMLPATLGLLLIPLTYLTLRALQTRPTTALLGSLFITFENGLITQSRFILLDSPVIFFTALSTFFWIGFSNENEVARDRAGRVGPFSRRWWAWLTLTGLALGAVVSCKWTGLFTIATVGVLTIVQLWSLLGDLRVPMPLLARHFAARAICLIAIPILFYMSMFAIHFAILNNSGEGDGFMSSEFQHTLAGHGMEDTFADVMVGSHITLRHLNTQGGYLHSHPHTYPGGSKQQQITLYPHRDDNNIWAILNTTSNPDIPNPETHSPPTPILDRHTVVLNHISTNKKLHSHDIRAPITEVDYQNEVSAYGFDGFEGDANDHFQIEIDETTTDVKSGKESRHRVQTLRTKFRLRHILTGCYLFSHKVKLPDWGFEQQEVTCNKNPSKENGLWFIETNTHAALPADAKKVNYRRPGFLAKFLELQGVMWQTNAGLTDRHAYDSRPHSWPTLRRGINFWVKDHRQIYLIGNPFVWLLSTLSVFAYVGVRGLLILRYQRGYKDLNHTQVMFYDRLCGFLVLGWFLHYFPFFLMSRQLFLHHYFPALYFAILLSACVFDLVTSFLKPRIRLQLVAFTLIITVWVYWYFSPLAYAGVWTRAQCESAKWGKNWDFSCADFHETAAEYLPKIAPSPRTDAIVETSKVAAVEPIGRPAEMIKAPASSALPERAEESEEEAPPEEASTASVDPRQKQEQEVAGAIPAAAGGTTELGGPLPAPAKEVGEEDEEREAAPVARNVEERQALRAKEWQENMAAAEDDDEEVEEVAPVRPRKALGGDEEVRRKKVVVEDEDEDLAEIDFGEDEEDA